MATEEGAEGIEVGAAGYKVGLRFFGLSGVVIESVETKEGSGEMRIAGKIGFIGKRMVRHSANAANNGLYYNQINGRLCAESDGCGLRLML